MQVSLSDRKKGSLHYTQVLILLQFLQLEIQGLQVLLLPFVLSK